MPIYKGRRPKTWRVTVFAKGKQHEWIVEGSKREAEAFESRKVLELEAGKPLTTRTAPLFASFCVDEYKPYAIKHLRESTWNKVRQYQVGTLINHFGGLKLTEITTAEVERFKTSRKVGATSVNNELRVLSVILRWARDAGFPCATPKIKRLPVKGSDRVHVWGASQILRLFESTQKEAPELLPLLVFLANTGCRKGEGIACEWSWIDLPGRMVRIPSNEVWRPKNGKPREVPISDALAVVLNGPKRSPQWVFPNRFGDRYAEFPKDLFSKLRSAAGLKGGPHTLRHSFASLFLAKCPDMFLLASVLGHSHSRVTELYSHLLPDHLNRARNAVDIAPAEALSEDGQDPHVIH